MESHVPRSRVILSVGILLAGFTAAALASGAAPAQNGRRPKVVVLGFDGADARLVEKWMASGDLPNLARLRDEGTYAPLLPTNPPQTPVSWAAFATGLNPGRTEVFDFLKRVEGTYLPDFAMASPTHRDVLFGARNPSRLGFGLAALLGVLAGLTARLARARWRLALGVGLAAAAVTAGPLYVVFDRWLPKRQPWAENGRRGTPFWATLRENGKSAAIFRLPVTFPAEDMGGGVMLSGLGVPDMRGGIGTPTLYTTDQARNPDDNEFAIRVVQLPRGSEASTDIQGPENLPFHRYAIDLAGEGIDSHEGRRRAEQAMKETLERRSVPKTLSVPLRIEVDPGSSRARLHLPETSLTLTVGEWSDWVTIPFPVNWLIDRVSPVLGMARFHLMSVEPEVNLYLAPVNFHPDFHPVPFSDPPNLTSKLADRFGLFKTIGWTIDTWTMSAGLADEAFTLADLRYTEEKDAEIMRALLAESEDDVFVHIFTGPDRAGHMLWRLMDPGHPMHDPAVAETWGDGLRQVYMLMDRIVGEARAVAPKDAVFIVCSDHGFSSYRRGINYNTWLAKNGFMTLSAGYGGYGQAKTLDDLFHGGTFFENVDWSRTKAYALGLGEIYINLEGREPQGIVRPGAEYAQVVTAIARGLEGFVDPATGERPVHRVYTREEIYPGFNAAVVPDLRVANNDNYRVEWQTALGGFTPEVVSDNLKLWSGDHCSLEPSKVMGVLFMNRAIRAASPRIVDLGPTILEAAGVAPPPGLDGVSLLPEGQGAGGR
jgi:predicted AlkP superfamily phosphohydrolase/phosphomutase